MAAVTNAPADGRRRRRRRVDVTLEAPAAARGPRARRRRRSDLALDDGPRRPPARTAQRRPREGRAGRPRRACAPTRQAPAEASRTGRWTRCAPFPGSGPRRSRGSRTGVRARDDGAQTFRATGDGRRSRRSGRDAAAASSTRRRRRSRWRTGRRPRSASIWKSRSPARASGPRRSSRGCGSCRRRRRDAPSRLLPDLRRPDEERPYAKVLLVAMDMRQLDLGMEAGVEDPEPLTGPPGTGRIPRDPQVYQRVAAAFNGGFKTEHGNYGMMVNKRVLLPPVAGAATVVVSNDGRVGMGTWGADHERRRHRRRPDELDRVVPSEPRRRSSTTTRSTRPGAGSGASRFPARARRRSAPASASRRPGT